MKTTVTVLNVRQGVIEENNQPWAHINIIGDDMTVNESLYGVNAAKLKFEDPQTAIRLMTELRKASIKMPCSLSLELKTKLQSNEMKMVVAGYELPKA